MQDWWPRGPAGLRQVAPRTRRCDDGQMAHEPDRSLCVVRLPPSDTGSTHPSRADGQDVEWIGVPPLCRQRHAGQRRRGQMAEDLVVAHERQESRATFDEIRRVECPRSHTVVRPVEVTPAHPSFRNTRRPSLRDGERHTRWQLLRQRHTSTHRPTLPRTAHLSPVIHNPQPSNCHKTLDPSGGCSGL